MQGYTRNAPSQITVTRFARAQIPVVILALDGRLLTR